MQAYFFFKYINIVSILQTLQNKAKLKKEIITLITMTSEAFSNVYYPMFKFIVSNTVPARIPYKIWQSGHSWLRAYGAVDDVGGDPEARHQAALLHLPLK